VLRIINEPTAAAIAFELDKREEEDLYFIVFDLGRTTLDVSLLCVDGGVFEVISLIGEIHVGGEDFNLRLVDHFIEIFKEKHGVDVAKDVWALQKLIEEVEKAKIDLSSAIQVDVYIENLINGIDFK